MTKSEIETQQSKERKEICSDGEIVHEGPAEEGASDFFPLPLAGHGDGVKARRHWHSYTTVGSVGAPPIRAQKSYLGSSLLSPSLFRRRRSISLGQK